MDSGIFDGGPPSRLLSWLRLRKGRDYRVLGPAATASAAWLPRAVLAAARGDLIDSPGADSFLGDIAVHARYLISLPLLIGAQSVCSSKLGLLAGHFRDAALVGDSNYERFDAAMV